MDAQQETQFVNAFIAPNRRERYVFMLSNSKRRQRLLDQLHHCRDIDPEVAKSPPSDECIVAHLRKLGAPDSCYVISTDATHDGNCLPLETVFAEYVSGHAMLISCVPGVLGCFVDEYGSATILRRK